MWLGDVERVDRGQRGRLQARQRLGVQVQLVVHAQDLARLHQPFERVVDRPRHEPEPLAERLARARRRPRARDLQRHPFFGIGAHEPFELIRGTWRRAPDLGRVHPDDLAATQGGAMVRLRHEAAHQIAIARQRREWRVHVQLHQRLFAGREALAIQEHDLRADLRRRVVHEHARPPAERGLAGWQ